MRFNLLQRNFQPKSAGKASLLLHHHHSRTASSSSSSGPSAVEDEAGAGGHLGYITMTVEFAYDPQLDFHGRSRVGSLGVKVIKGKDLFPTDMKAVNGQNGMCVSFGACVFFSIT